MSGQSAEELLSPREVPAEQVCGIKQAGETIEECIRKNMPVVIVGDYDADGITSTTILTRLLYSMGVKVRPIIPRRFTDGYGVSDSILKGVENSLILMSVGYGVGIVPESWIDAIEYIASPLDGPQGLWKGDKNTGDTQTSSQDNAAVQGTRTQVSGTLNVEFIDVGQADAILIYNDENAMLIDAGNNPDGKPLTNYIKSLGIDHLDYVIGTHNHEDHIGGMDDVITAYSSEVDYIMLSEEEGTTATYRSVVEAADSSSAEQLTPKAGETYTLGDATWQILSCDTDMPDLNESSIVIKLTYGNTSFLFTGDATMNTEQGLEMSGYDLKSDVLKVGHHGSAGSTADSFLDAVAPEIAVISVDSESDMGEMYHHPATSTLQRLSQHGIKVYRTDELGTIRITSDGEKLAVSAFATSTDGT